MISGSPGGLSTRCPNRRALGVLTPIFHKQQASFGCPSCNAWRNRCHSRRVLGVLIAMSNKSAVTAGESWYGEGVSYGAEILNHSWRVEVTDRTGVDSRSELRTDDNSESDASESDVGLKPGSIEGDTCPGSSTASNGTPASSLLPSANSRRMILASLALSPPI